MTSTPPPPLPRSRGTAPTGHSADEAPACTRAAGPAGVDVGEVAAEFRYFAVRRAGSYAPLYARLATAIADDPDLLAVAVRARAGQSRPDLLLALIHDLLLRDPGHPAARFYPSLTAHPADGDPAPAVLRLARDHRDELTARITKRLVQTNEVGRCTFLAPAIQATAARRPGTALAVIEVGASAGLNLHLDAYGYRYQRAGTDPTSTDIVAERPGRPVLDCALDGPRTPPLDQPLAVTWRAGIDLNPLDVTDPADRRWLRALVWPDHRDRAARLDAALHVARAADQRPVVHAGDAATELPRLVAAAPAAAQLVIYHSAVAAHMPPAARQALTDAVLTASVHRPVSWVQAEPRPDRDPRRLRLTECHDGEVTADLALGSYQPHGQWLRWEHDGDHASDDDAGDGRAAGQLGRPSSR